MKENRIPDVRFAPEVPRDECINCKLARQGHPLLKSVRSTDNEEVCNLLCIKDCLKQKISMKLDETECYNLLNSNCIQGAMRCECVAETPKGVKYHPALKAVYERSGAKGMWTKTGYKCPKCKRFYDLDGGQG